MHARRLILAAVLAASVMPLAYAQGWPSRPVRIVVPAPAGSSLDIIARLLGDKLKDRWGQPVVVENKPGAGGMLGRGPGRQGNTDGHTLAIGFNGPIAFAPFLYRKMPYDPAKDLIPVVMTTSQPNVLAVNAGRTGKDVKEFVDWAKSRGGKLNYSSLGMGSSAHLTMELFLAESGASGTHVPFNGSPPAAHGCGTGRGRCDLHGRTGAAGACARWQGPPARSVEQRQRPDSLKDLPTLAEAGYPDVESLAWNGLFTAAGTPDTVVQKINADVDAALQDPRGQGRA